MNHRELLALAAKSIDYVIESDETGGYVWCYNPTSIKTDNEYPIFLWNPIASNNDAFELQVELGLVVSVNFDYTSVGGWSDIGDMLDVDHAGDKHAATRLAIVRAAAEIGKKNDS